MGTKCRGEAGVRETDFEALLVPGGQCDTTGGVNRGILQECWLPRVRRQPLSEIALWITGSPASWRVSQTPECNGLLTATRGVCMSAPQRQPGKFNWKWRAGVGGFRSQLPAEAGESSSKGSRVFSISAKSLGIS